MANSPSSPSCGGRLAAPVDPMVYADALAVLKRALKLGIDPSLDGIVALAEQLGRPHDRFASVQVTGTNGKTSTSRLIQAILHAHGLHTGLFTSPELVRYPERMELDGRVVSDDTFARAVTMAVRASEALERPVTEFELLTAAALWLFDAQEVDLAVMEVGIGGTWDSTSVVSPTVAVVTGVGIDHEALLGNTLESIAGHKAGIIKPASAPILGPGTRGLERIFLERAEACDTHARLVREVGEPTLVDEELTVRYEVDHAPVGAVRTHGVPSPWSVDVRGVHASYPGLTMPTPSIQALNVATAVAACEAALGRALDPALVRSAVASCPTPGRFELLRAEPPLVIDGSHNPEASAVLTRTVADAFSGRPPVVLLGVLAEKDARGIVEAMASVASRLVVTASDSPRALPARELADVVEETVGVRPECFDRLTDALDVLVDATPDGLLVAGSLTTAGQTKGYWLETRS